MYKNDPQEHVQWFKGFFVVAMVVEFGAMVQLLFLAEICIRSRSYLGILAEMAGHGLFMLLVSRVAGGGRVSDFSKPGALPEDCSHLRDF